jgi:hypothetical protein
MPLPIDAEMRALCAEILAWMRDEPEWRDEESSDMFQSGHYCGGWESDEDAFTFSHYDADGHEDWFNLTPADIEAAATGRLVSVEVRPPS